MPVSRGRRRKAATPAIASGPPPLCAADYDGVWYRPDHEGRPDRSEAGVEAAIALNEGNPSAQVYLRDILEGYRGRERRREIALKGHRTRKARQAAATARQPPAGFV